MALEDVCNFKKTPDFPALSFESAASSLHMTDPNSQLTSNSPLAFEIPNSAIFSSENHPLSVSRPFTLTHGTTTLGFVFQGGVIAAADTRASAGGLVACPSSHKAIPIHSHLVVTSSGSSADCTLWKRMLFREMRLYELRNKRRLSIRGSAKLLAFMLHPFKGTDVCVALTLCGWDRAEDDREIPHDSSSILASASGHSSLETGSDVKISPDNTNCGPRLIFVCSDGTRLQNNIISVGSGSPYAYGILDDGLSWNLSNKEAFSLARQAVFRATHRDAYSGNNVDLFHITAAGWKQRERENLREEYYRDQERKAKEVEERKRGKMLKSAK